MANKKSGLSRFFGFASRSSNGDAEHDTSITKRSSNGDAEDDTSITKFTFQELAAATRNFAPESLLGEGEYGRTNVQMLSSQVVAVRQVDEDTISTVYRFRDQSIRSTIHLRSLLHHPNIVDMIGYSINDKDELFFVYEFMPLGCLTHHLHEPLDWNTRMKIAAGAAKGIKCLHDKPFPLVIHGKGYHPKLADFLVFRQRIPEPGESTHCRFFGRHCHRHAPEFLHEFELTQQSDIYCFGVVLLELISGRMAAVNPNLVKWAKHILVVDSAEFTTVADPVLKGQYPEQGLYQALFLAAECLHGKDVSRPRMGYVVNVLSNLASEIYDPNAIQINQAGTLAIGKIEKERLTAQWQHAWFSYIG
ncbi:hypothetical protein MKW94_005879 [Papaver nudicaule]|uniref:Protein kinase domain-containing protein n=1 Tax=Papaver nudicaule TaxID=74823 RepID=A0AA42B170_PAPNU|nr:hypothetical protein [Papaver nudicaule]